MLRLEHFYIVLAGIVIGLALAGVTFAAEKLAVWRAKGRKGDKGGGSKKVEEENGKMEIETGNPVGKMKGRANNEMGNETRVEI